MGKPTGFKEWHREGAERRPVSERLDDYRELYKERPAAVRVQQGGRCMDCGVPFCHQGCPLGNLIPDFNDDAYEGDWKRAFTTLSSTNNFPEFTGRLCPAPCEAACVLAINDKPVTIEQIELEIVEEAWSNGWVTPRVPRADQRTGKTVAVVGSGPAGLAAAQQLARAGHEVTVFERDDRVGGLLRYGIPDFKMEKHVIDRRLAQLEAEGVRFRTKVHVGEDLSWAELRDTHDAVVVAIGAQRARDLQVDGRQLDGVVFAMDFLTQQNRRVAGDLVPDPISAEGRHVIILGGGDTGSDCLGTSHRQGAASVRQIELFPEPPEARAKGNPWPQWPLVFRTSSSQEEGGDRDYALMTTRLEGDADGRISKLHAVHVEIVDGRPVPVEGSEVVYDCDLLVLAMGFVSPITEALVAQLGVELDRRGNVATTDFQTSVPGVFAAGDAQRGASLIVWAISDGRECARAVDAALVGHARLPTRGRHLAFGGR
ncbi:MAG: glutamate synthase subunit beta [Alphaproteobacteria bacterium]|nr:glutamate synthase subunit beta [Alphaproteobacteria bacterium]